MTLGLNVTLVGDRQVIARLGSLGGRVVAKLSTAIDGLVVMLQAYIVRSKLSGQVLKRRSGALSNSIQFAKAQASQVAVFGRVFSAGDVKYAAIHEFGGIIEHPGGTSYIPTDMGARFISNERADALRAAGWDLPRTRPHPIPMPERSFMRSSLRDKQAMIGNTLRNAAMEAARETLPPAGGTAR